MDNCQEPSYEVSHTICYNNLVPNFLLRLTYSYIFPLVHSLVERISHISTITLHSATNFAPISYIFKYHTKFLFVQFLTNKKWQNKSQCTDINLQSLFQHEPEMHISNWTLKHGHFLENDTTLCATINCQGYTHTHTLNSNYKWHRYITVITYILIYNSRGPANISGHHTHAHTHTHIQSYSNQLIRAPHQLPMPYWQHCFKADIPLCAAQLRKTLSVQSNTTNVVVIQRYRLHINTRTCCSTHKKIT